MITRTLIALVAALSFVSVAAAQVQPSPAQALSLAQIEQRLAADGFRVLEIERYPNSVEVKGFDRDGNCMELHLDPVTGAIVHRERDDGCGSGEDHSGHGRH